MKSINIKLGLKEIIGILIILILFNYGFYEIQDYKFRFGNVVLLDTLTGSVKLKTGNYYGDSIYMLGWIYSGSGIETPAGFHLDRNNSFIDNDGFDMQYNTYEKGIHSFLNGAVTEMTIDTTDGVRAYKGIMIDETNGLFIPGNDSTVRIFMVNDNLVFHFKGADANYFYIALDSAGDQVIRRSDVIPTD
jgi:hypothetical protein